MTVQDALGLSTVDLMTRIPKSEWAAISSRTSVYDCTPALASALSTGKRVTISMPGRYKLGTAYVGMIDFDVEALCSGVEFDLSDVGGSVGISNAGTLSQIESLTSTISLGSSVATFASAPSLQPGDWFCVWNPTDYSYLTWADRPYYRAGEWKQVLSISGDVVTTTQPFYASYGAGDVEVYRLNSVKCRLAGVHLVGASSPPGTLVRFSLCDGPVVERVTFDVATDAVLGLNRCVRGLIRDLIGVNRGGITNDYGLVIGNSQHVRIFGGDIYARRHAVALGGGGELGSVPTRDVHGYDMVLRNDPNSNVGASDMHGNVEHCSYERCTIYGAANIGGGNNNWYKGCQIYAPGGTATPWVGSFREIKGGRSGYVDCDMFTFGNPWSESRGVIDMNGSGASAVSASTVLPFSPTIRNCRLTAPALTSASTIMTCINRGADVAINPEIDGLTLIGVTALSSILRTNNASGGTPLSDGIIVDNIAGAPTGTLLHSVQGGHYLSFPHRLQKQNGIWASTSAAATSVISGPIDFPLVYPRKPRATISIGGAGTATFTGQVGGQVPSLTLYQVTGALIRPQIRSSPAMTAGDNFDVSWAVELREC